MAEFSSKEASAAVILLIYMSGKLQGLRDNKIFYRSSARCLGPAIRVHLAGVPGVSTDSWTKRTELGTDMLCLARIRAQPH
jgi:hypothetical protein